MTSADQAIGTARKRWDEEAVRKRRLDKARARAEQERVAAAHKHIDTLNRRIRRFPDIRLIRPLIVRSVVRTLVHIFMTDPDPSVKQKALFVLSGAWGVADRGFMLHAVQPAFDLLLNALFDEERLLGVSAAILLGHIGDARAYEPLLIALKDQRLRSSAASALGRLGKPEAVEPLISLLAKESHPHTCDALALALGALGDRRAIEPILKAFPKMQAWAAAKALQALTGEDLGRDEEAWRRWWEARHEEPV